MKSFCSAFLTGTSACSVQQAFVKVPQSECLGKGTGRNVKINITLSENSYIPTVKNTSVLELGLRELMASRKQMFIYVYAGIQKYASLIQWISHQKLKLFFFFFPRWKHFNYSSKSERVAQTNDKQLYCKGISSTHSFFPGKKYLHASAAVIICFKEKKQQLNNQLNLF